MARALMLQGTGSDVGKTVLVAGLCRVAKLRGLKVAPFKPQNMSTNAAVADDGGEIGRAQWLQALAAGMPPSVHMNPVLLKPQTETGAQIIVHGKVQGRAEGRDYQGLKAGLLDAVLRSYRHLRESADLVLVEGAGSPAEINLRAGDIANMGFACAADVPVVLVGDIHRGGVIASLVGTHTILPEADAGMIIGYLINKFRGDVSLFDDGLAAITDFTGWHSFGVVPWLRAANRLPPEDSPGFMQPAAHATRKLRIVVPVLPHMANFDDLDPLYAEPDVELVLLKDGQAFPPATDVVILTGSKATIADMRMLEKSGRADELRHYAAKGGRVIGICGGYQMLGKRIYDPQRIEGDAAEITGLGLLDVETVMRPEKIVRNVRGYASGEPVSGYEIHLGETHGADCARAPVMIENRPDGAASADGCVWGCYLHGLFNAGRFRQKFLHNLGRESDGRNHQEKIEEALNDIASELEKVLDIDALFAAAR
ncbi:MAG: Cobyric acid synthase [Candidatus Tokpelaia hoelldobleri]|uniref:Cobyric acid synthase n=1 Tax=Candidatus Tokpelaia hoelldobleri TaxID=1902579 RepID=A0A1U9JUJ6_9HYPH|nr:MAG: Cobyric acid synthase [Candidatus Tokpelaia hoelldoblerii]